MRLPTFNLNFFKKTKPPKKRITTTFGKRRSSSTSSTRKSRRSSSGRKTSRKRSITYYSPSKSKFYPTEYFPSLQRVAAQATVAATPPASNRSRNVERNLTVSTDANDATAKINNNYVPASVLYSHTAKHTYLCDDDERNVVLHEQPFSSLKSTQSMRSRHAQDVIHYQTQTNDLYELSHKKPNRIIDANGNVIVTDDAANRSHNLMNNGHAYLSTYSKECKQGVSALTMPSTISINSIPYTDANNKQNVEQQRQSHNNLLPSNLTAMNCAYTAVYPTHNTAAKYLNNNSNAVNLCSVSNACPSLATATTQQLNPSFLSFHGATTIPMTKKSERHRRRKVRYFWFFCFFILF